MKLSKRLGLMLVVGIMVIAGAELGERLSVPGVHSATPAAEARVGRPLTPVSIAGVARRTVRRCAVGVYNC